jgi:vacuolar-type H+-ATPase subunit E/Vma4
MSGPLAELAPLLETIAEEARREAGEIVDAARGRAEATAQRAELEARSLESQAASRGRVEGEEEARRQLALARLEARQALLRERDGHVEGVLEEARRRVAELAQGPEAGRVLADLIAGARRALDERGLRVRVRARDRARLTEVTPPDVEIVVDDAALDEPGVVVTTLDGRRRMDLTLAAILRRRREAARRAAAALLFAEEPAS